MVLYPETGADSRCRQATRMVERAAESRSRRPRPRPHSRIFRRTRRRQAKRVKAVVRICRGDSLVCCFASWQPAGGRVTARAAVPDAPDAGWQPAIQQARQPALKIGHFAGQPFAGTLARTCLGITRRNFHRELAASTQFGLVDPSLVLVAQFPAPPLPRTNRGKPLL